MAEKHYVDNKQLFEVMKQYRSEVLIARAHEQTPPPIPSYVGECILMIANRLSTKPNFVNYSYRDEMISDGVENCICYIDNFDPAKSDNPFAYFTQIIYFAFLRRINKEKKQLYIKHKSFENSAIMNELFEQGELDTYVPASTYDIDQQHTSDFIKSFEDSLDKKKVKRKKGLENFFEEDAAEE